MKKKKISQLDPSLLKKNLKSDRRTQTEVYTKYYSRVYTSCLRILNDVHEAEDLMQEAFIHAFKKIDSFRGDADLGTWICRIGINKCLDHLKKRRVPLDFDDNWENKVSGSYNIEGDSNYDVERIQKAMKELPDGCRVVFNLHMFEEMDHETIARRIGIKEASSRAQYARAKNKIKELISETYV